MHARNRFLTVALVGLAACGGIDGELSAQNAAFSVERVADFEDPWALNFLPDGRLLVTEKSGELKLLDVDSGAVGDIAGVPEVAYRGQGGFGDIVLHPDFASNNMVYMSYVESGSGGTGVSSR